MQKIKINNLYNKTAAAATASQDEPATTAATTWQTFKANTKTTTKSGKNREIWLNENPHFCAKMKGKQKLKNYFP